MSGSFEKSVKGATKIKAAPPKTKYIEHILVATHSGEAGISEVFRALQFRLRDSTWTVVFKGLITVHMMIREGEPDATLEFLARHRNMLAISSFTDAQTQGRNIRRYANYLNERARAYRETHTDWVRAPESRLEKLSVDKGLLRETEFVQRQLSALLKCDVLETDTDNEITLTVFRLLVLDLLSLFQVLNQGMINILGHFFEMPKSDAERAMDIYRAFARQTDFVVAYLGIARQHQHQTRVEVPKLKHAPVNLTRQLEDYLKDPDFEVHRRQYIAEQDAKGNGPKFTKAAPKKELGLSFPEPAPNNPFPKAGATKSFAPAETKPQAPKGPDPDLIDFFDSIEQNQTTMQVNPQQTASPPNAFMQQPTGMPMQTNAFVQQQQPTGFAPAAVPFQQQQAPPPQAQALQPNFTGAGFGGYTPQPSFQPGSLGSIPQNTVASFQNQVQMPMQQPMQQPMQTGQPLALQPMQTGSTNPFRQSMLMQQQQQQPVMQSNPGTPPFSPTTLKRQSTNPFARTSQNSSPFNSNSPSPFPAQQQQQQQQVPSPAAPLQPMATGTNPFARSNTMPNPSTGQEQRPQTAGAIVPQSTGPTNPFRQGAFVNHATGMGWQHNQAVIGGGIDQVQTTPVFPRPAQQTPWQ